MNGKGHDKGDTESRSRCILDHFSIITPLHWKTQVFLTLLLTRVLTKVESNWVRLSDLTLQGLQFHEEASECSRK